jgi:crossover junction endodeoxyribonuclease RuvC
MIVLGIDPGTRHLGWGVLSRAGTRVTHVAHGVIDVDEEGSLAERLVEIDTALEAIIAEHRPEVGAVEGLFFHKDAQSAAKLGHARGVVLLRLARAGMAIKEYAPALVKRTVVGKGAADKKQVAMVVSAVLRLPAPPRSDAADALAIAMTHLQVASFEEALGRSGVVPRPSGSSRRGPPGARRAR